MYTYCWLGSTSFTFAKAVALGQKYLGSKLFRLNWLALICSKVGAAIPVTGTDPGFVFIVGVLLDCDES